MEKKIIIIDNYDSFTYNIVHAIEDICKHKVTVFRNDKISLKQVEAYDYVIISPGPGIPEESGETLNIIKKYYKSKKIFGVCLGLQAIAVALGGKLENLNDVFHGIESPMSISESCPIYNDVSNPFQAGRYHSWVVNETNLTDDLIINCRDEQGQIMGFHHKDYPVYGVQFHPESIMTKAGNKMFENFLNI